MKKINDYLDATYLKTPKQANISIEETNFIINNLLEDAVINNYKCIMIRPEYVHQSKQYLLKNNSKVLVGTVVDFPKGEASLEMKLYEAQQAILNGADELDFVVNYKAFKKGELKLIEQEIKECTTLCLNNHKTVKWIIETAALTNMQIVKLTVLIKKVIVRNFKEIEYVNVFVKSSTGFYKTKNEKPNGANPYVITLMIENATPLPVKASGGIKTLEQVLFYLNLGVKRIGTSAQKNIVQQNKSV